MYRCMVVYQTPRNPFPFPREGYRRVLIIFQRRQDISKHSTIIVHVVVHIFHATT